MHFAMRLAGRRARYLFAYAATVLLPVAILVLVLRAGPHVLGHGAEPAGNAVAQAVPHAIPGLALVIAQVALIVACARAAGALGSYLHQPPVIGEMIAGIALGPSLFGWLAPRAFALVFPPLSFTLLNVLSQLGLLVFMFMVGLEFDFSDVKKEGPVAMIAGHASIAVSMAFGALLALYLYPRFAGRDAGFLTFALFLGASLSMTAFPVLARILRDRKMLRAPLGASAIACAAMVDATGWCVLAYVVAQARAGSATPALLRSIGGLAIFVAVMFLVVRPLLRRIERSYHASGDLTDTRKAVVLLVMLLAGLTTELLSLHVVFGAFVAGAAMPRSREFVSYLTDKFEALTVLLFLPLFFVYIGLRTSMGQIHGASMWLVCALVITLATAGKIGGTGLAAWLAGADARRSAALGTLMNARGLMELIVLNIGLDLKVITPALFSILVLMAVVTTVMTAPLLAVIERPATGGQAGITLSVESRFE